MLNASPFSGFFFRCYKIQIQPLNIQNDSSSETSGWRSSCWAFLIEAPNLTNSPRWVVIAPPWPAFVSSSLWFRRGAVAGWARRHPSHAWVRRRSKMSWRRNGEKPTGWHWAEAQQKTNQEWDSCHNQPTLPYLPLLGGSSQGAPCTSDQIIATRPGPPQR